MKKVWFALALVLPVVASAGAGDERTQVPSRLTFAKDIKVERLSTLTNHYYFEEDLNEKCSVSVESLAPTEVKKGQALIGSSTVLDRVIQEDGDAIGSTITSQFTFRSDDGQLIVAAACFDSGLIFKSVPSLAQLIKLLKSKQLVNLEM